MLSPEALQAFLDLGVRGYTVRRIKELMEAQGHNIGHVPDAALCEILLQSEDVLAEQREALDARTRKQFGLADRLERVRRLAEAAEAIEKFIGQDPKWTAEYRRLLATIRAEMEPLGIEVRPGDEWADLLHQLMEVSDVGEGHARPANGDPEAAGDGAIPWPVEGDS